MNLPAPFNVCPDERAESLQLESKLARLRETCELRLEEYRQREAAKQDARMSRERLWWKEETT